jgi:hypothetical protein
MRDELQRGTWKAPTTGRGTRKLFLNHIDEERGRTAARGSHTSVLTWTSSPVN